MNDCVFLDDALVIDTDRIQFVAPEMAANDDCIRLLRNESLQSIHSTFHFFMYSNGDRRKKKAAQHIYIYICIHSST